MRRLLAHGLSEYLRDPRPLRDAIIETGRSFSDALERKLGPGLRAVAAAMAPEGDADAPAAVGEGDGARNAENGAEGHREAVATREFPTVAPHSGNPPMTCSEVEQLYADAMAERDRLEAAVARVRGLHQPYQTEDRTQCDHCMELCHSRSGLSCDTPYDAPWPCPTIEALDGEAT
jgi:hypothetical protein